MCGVPPSANLNTTKIKQVNEVFKVLCESRSSAHYIDTFNDMYQNNAHEVTTDGTHPNVKGEDILVNNIRQEISKPYLSLSHASSPPLTTKEYQKPSSQITNRSQTQYNSVPSGGQESTPISQADNVQQRTLSHEEHTQVKQVTDNKKDPAVVPCIDTQHQRKSSSKPTCEFTVHMAGDFTCFFIHF